MEGGRSCDVCDGSGRDPLGDGGGWGAGSCPECGGTGKERGRGAARRIALASVNELRVEDGLDELDRWPIATENCDPLNLALPEGWKAVLTIQDGARCGWLYRPGEHRADFLLSLTGAHDFLEYFHRGFYPDLLPKPSARETDDAARERPDDAAGYAEGAGGGQGSRTGAAPPPDGPAERPEERWVLEGVMSLMDGSVFVTVRGREMSFGERTEVVPAARLRDTEQLAREAAIAAHRQEERAKAAEQRAVDAEEALRWYADERNWDGDGRIGEWVVEEGNPISGDGFTHDEWECDNGERARAALARLHPDREEHDGERCHACGRAYEYVWWCDDPELWELVTGHAKPPGGDARGLRCIDCFDREARKHVPWIEWMPINARHLTFHPDRETRDG